MYSRNIVEKNLAQYPYLQRLSVAESQNALKHFTSKANFTDDGEFVSWRQDLNAEEEKLILNEALLSKYDFLYAAERYAYIMDWQKNLVLFKPNIAQQIKLEIYAELEELLIAIIAMALKARQLGSSTLDELIVWHRAMFWPHTNAIVGSSDPTKSAKMFQMVERAWNLMPFYLKPRCTKFSKGQFYDFDYIDSHISIQHGNQFSGIGRGDTPNVGHLSEICDFDDPAQLIDASLLKSLHEIPSAFLVLESTANGRGDWWHDNWLINRENEAIGLAKMKPIFLPWFVGSDIYPSKTWLRARPVPSEWKPKESTMTHAVKAAEYVRNTPLLRRHLGSDWIMPITQMWWYEVERHWATQKNELNIFLSECPANEEEAFQSRTGSIFSADIITERRDNARLPKVAYSIMGDSISERLVVPSKQHKLDAKPLIIGHTPPSSTISTLRWQAMPLTVDSGVFDPMNKLCMWETPKEGQHYEIAIDTGYGIGEDRTVIQVGRRAAPGENDAQVAEWASSWAGALDIWPIVMAIGKIYTVFDPASGLMIQPRITIEMAANGEALQAELRKLGWTNFYIRTRLATELKGERIIEPKLGWTTSWTTRPKLLDHLIKIVRDNLVEINSPWLVDELADLQRSEKNLKIEAPKGRRDDRLMAFAILAYVMYDMDPRGETAHIYKRKQELINQIYSVPSAPTSNQSSAQGLRSDEFQWI